MQENSWVWHKVSGSSIMIGDFDDFKRMPYVSYSMERDLESIVPLTATEYTQIQGYCEGLAKEPSAPYTRYFVPLHYEGLRLLKRPHTSLNPSDPPQVRTLYCPRTQLTFSWKRDVFDEKMDFTLQGYVYRLELLRGCQSAKGLDLDHTKNIVHALFECAKSWVGFVADMEPARFFLLKDDVVISQHDYAPHFLHKD
jgi:hypothetical protein